MHSAVVPSHIHSKPHEQSEGSRTPKGGRGGGGGGVGGGLHVVAAEIKQK